MKLSFLFCLFVASLSFASTHIVVVGDTGKDNEGQRIVADAMTQHCQMSQCDLGILTGDNIYEEGMESTNDPILDQVFKKYYSQLQIPFYIALGNHDYGRISNDWKRGGYQLEYSKRNPQYHLPNYYYYEVLQDAVLVFLDTSRLMWGKDIEDQEKMVAEAYAKSDGKWFIVVGHHPYLSNGNHGNAGNYERLPFPPFVSGSHVKKFIEKNVCGKAQLYVSGHDHNLQLIDGMIKNCKTQFAVSGAGASTEDLTSRNASTFQAQQLGYLALTVNLTTMRLEFLDSNNNTLFIRDFLSPSLEF
jgi:tartrate-resistant acid phosphatase type 5